MMDFITGLRCEVGLMHQHVFVEQGADSAPVAVEELLKQTEM